MIWNIILGFLNAMESQYNFHVALIAPAQVNSSSKFAYGSAKERYY